LVIIEVARLVRHWGKFKSAYEAWERLQVERRFSGWSVPRRLAMFVILPTALICCGGGVFGLPTLWFVNETLEAGRGAPSSEAVASEYLMRFSYNDTDGLLPLLDDDQQERLLDQWQDYQDAMSLTDPPPTRLDVESLRSEPAMDERVRVSAEVQFVWVTQDENGRRGGYGSTPRTWVIETRDEDGWRIVRVVAPPWCGPDGYVPRCESAGGDVPPTTPAASIAPSSPDPLQHPREMLRCGPRDPFRAWHSCPPMSSAPTE
jgi:hypothetical protein